MTVHDPAVHQPVADCGRAAGPGAQGRLPRARAHRDDGRRAGEAVARGDQEAHPDAAVHGRYLTVTSVCIVVLDSENILNNGRE